MLRLICLSISLVSLLLPCSLLAQTADLTVTVEGLLLDAEATITVERGVGGLDDAVLAVSYTHLTLPTNREV